MVIVKVVALIGSMWGGFAQQWVYFGTDYKSARSGAAVTLRSWMVIYRKILAINLFNAHFID